jgi:superfamily II DNA or RNA helicase
MANFVKDKKYTMRVKRIDSFNGRKSYVVDYEGNEYRVRMYPHQSEKVEEIGCYYIGDNDFGRPQFQQDYQDVLYEVYEEDCVYPFKLINDCTDMNTGAQFYVLSDQYGFNHRVYNQQSPLYKIGDDVEARVIEVGSKYLSLELLPKATPTASFSIGDLVNLNSIVTPEKPKIDFSLLNPEADTTLRDYQIENKRKIYQAWQNNRSVMLQMPTGTGKTRLFVSIARDLFNYGVERKKAVKILFLAHRKELIEQISDHLGGKYRLAHGLIISQSIEQKKFPMQIGSVPTLTRRLERWEDKDFDIIIIDEAHHVKAKSYKKIIDFYPNAKILGVTATPYRLNGAGFRPEFDDLIISPSVAEFIKRGYLSEYVYYSIRPTSELQKEIDRMKLDFEGDYKESEMMGVMDRDYIRAGILSTYQKFAEGKKGIVYTINREHNTHLAYAFNQAGIVSAAIDSETPKEKRDELVQKFRRGDIQVLFNVNIFSEGFDCPDVEVIQLARPTKSLAMYLQQVGRGLRPHGSKEKLIILDNVGLFNKFGFPSARRKWRYHFEGRPVDETPAAHLLDREEDREVMDIFEGDETVEMLHDSHNEVVEETTLDSIQHDYEKSFIDYAQGILNAHTAKGYARNIRPHLDNYIRKHFDPTFKSLFNIIDQDRLKEIRDTLKHDKDFSIFNARKHNVFSAALARYRAFAEWYAQHHTDDVPLPPIDMEEVTPSANEASTAPILPSPAEEDLDREIDSLQRAIAFSKKKNFPIPKEMTAELDRLLELKKKGQYSSIVKQELEDAIDRIGLGKIRAFSYNPIAHKIVAEAGVDYEVELQDEVDMEELLRIMNKFHLEISDEVKQKKERIHEAKEIQGVVDNLKDTLDRYISSKQYDDIYIRNISYSDEAGIDVEFGKFVLTAPNAVIYSKVSTRRGSQQLKVTFGDGTVICCSKAKDTYLGTLEKIGIDRIRDFKMSINNRPFFDSMPHPKYPTQSYQLSSGDWVNTNIGNEKKVAILNEIAAQYSLDFHAELV